MKWVWGSSVVNGNCVGEQSWHMNAKVTADEKHSAAENLFDDAECLLQQLVRRHHAVCR